MCKSAVLAAFTLAATLQAADPTLLNLVMPDVTVLAGINVQKAKTSAFGQFLLMQMPDNSGLDQFVAATGFDPRRDVSEVLIASNAAGKQSGLVMARGTFNTGQIEAAVLKDGKHVSQYYKGAELITSSTTGDQGSIAFLPSGIAVAGDLSNVKAAIDRSTGNNPIPPALAAKVAGYAGADAWTVSLAPLTSFGGGDAGANPIAGALKAIQQSSGSVTFSSPVQVEAEGVTQNDQDAASLSDVIKFLASMMQSDKSAAPFAGILQGINVTTDHSIIKISVSIPEDQIEQLIKGAQQEKTAKKAKAVHV